MWTENFQMFKLDLEKAEEAQIKLPTSTGPQKSKRVPEKYLLLLYWLHWRFWLCGSQTVWFTNCGKYFKRWEYQITLPASWEICKQVKKLQLEPEKEQWTGSKLRKE